MSNIKKGAKLTVSTGNGISRHTTQNLGILEVSGPAMLDTTTDYTTNTAQLTIGATDVSGVLKLGINNDGNTFIDAIRGGNHTDIIMQKYGGDVIIGSGADSIAKVGIRTNAPDSTFHINSTDGLIIPVGTNGERPDPAYNGMIRYNTTTSQFEGYGPGSAWGSLGGVKDVDGDTYILAESSANADNDDLQFFTAGQERMSINSVGDISMNGATYISGNLLLGTTTDSGYQLSTSSINCTNNLNVSGTITGNVTGNVTGNCSGTAATVTTAAQPNITSLGTLTSLNVSGTITGNVTGNCSGTAATVTTAAQPNITSLGTLTSLNVSGNIGGTNGILVNNNGVGISHAAPTNSTYQLEVGGSVKVDSNLIVDGNVGIGTTTSYAKLICQGTSEPTTGSGYTNTPANMAWPIVVNNVSGATQYNTGYGCGIKFKQYLDNINDQRWSGIAGVSQNEYSNYTGLTFYTCNNYVVTEKMRILHNGNVGIGTTTPNAGLEVTRRFTQNIGTLGYLSSDGSTGTYAYNTQPIAIAADGYVWAYGNDGRFVVSSDERIKTNIVDVPDNLALEMVRNIPCRYYEYKDNLYSGTDKTIGFIAQEVKEILPMAVSLQKSIIPNEMRTLTDISWNGNTLHTDLDDVSGVKYRFYVSNDVSGNDEIKKEIIGNSDNSFTFDEPWNNVFCYGKEVDDFHTLDKQKLFTLNFSATQEIDRIQQQHIIDISNAQSTIQSHETTIQTLQTDLSNANTTIQQHETTIQQQQQQIADILSRLESLESSA